MNVSSNVPSPDPASQTADDIQAQHRRLRILTQATALSVLILTGTVFIFLYRQVVLVRRQTGELARYLTEVDKSGMQDFAEKVRDSFNTYRKEHPDFNPIYTRYFGTNEPAPREKITPAPAAAAATNTVR